MTVELGSFTGGPVSSCMFFSALISVARQKWFEAPLSALAMHTTLLVGGFTGVITCINGFMYLLFCFLHPRSHGGQ